MQSNSYRIYSDTCLFQFMVARTLFRCEFGYAGGKENFTAVEELTQEYLTTLKREYANALSAVSVVEKWLRQESRISKHTYSRKDAAFILDTTPESMRNRERNRFITVPRLNKNTLTLMMKNNWNNCELFEL